MKNKPLLWLFLLLAAQQAAFIILFPPFTEPDSAGYISSAMTWLSSGVFVSQTRPPGYPAFLAAIFSFAPNWDLAVVIAQHLLGLLVWALFMRMLETQRQKVVFTVLYLCDLMYSSYQHVILADFFFSLLLCLSAYVVMLYMKTRKAALLWTLSLLITAGILTKPVLKLFPFFILPVFLLDHRPWRSRLASALIILLVPLALTNLWDLRNYRVNGYFAAMPLETYHYIGRIVNHAEFPEGSLAKKYFLSETGTVPAARDRKAPIVFAVMADLRRDGVSDETMDREFKQIFRLSILRHPFIYMKESGEELALFFLSAHNLYAKNALKEKMPVSVFQGLREGRVFPVLLKVLASMHVFYWFIFALLLRHAALSLRGLVTGGGVLQLYMYGLITYIALLSSMLNEGLARFRCEIQPFMLFFAAIVLADLFSGGAPETAAEAPPGSGAAR